MCPDLDSYRAYIQGSKAEWSVAKHGYVVGRAGWFSCRSACYLASGRPVVVQDTGFSDVLPTGDGLLAFETPGQAADAIDSVVSDYDRHARAARELALAYFDSGAVLSRPRRGRHGPCRRRAADRDMRALIAGWFSFEGMGATAGDLMARDLCAEWLLSRGWSHDVAVARPFVGGVDWRTVDPDAYDMVVFVCGPFGNGWPVTGLLERFAGKRLVGLNLSMLEDLDAWNPFDALIERDSSRASNPDISFLSEAPRVPLVGVVLVHPQKEYPEAMHGRGGCSDRSAARRP